MPVSPEHLLKLACEAAENAYAPYSGFKVGASVLYKDGSVYSGCNVENASYGLSLCAERSAISSAIKHGKHTGLLAIAICSQNAGLCFPCGACRQWITEFSKDAKIIVRHKSGLKEYSAQELLPHSFSLD